MIREEPKIISIYGKMIPTNLLCVVEVIPISSIDFMVSLVANNLENPEIKKSTPMPILKINANSQSPLLKSVI
jgi:hypothetical protein